MIWIALISMFGCSSGRSTMESARENARQPPSAWSRGDIPPSVTLVVSATPAISNAIVTGALNEATAIWRVAGFTFGWRVSNGPSGASEPSTVHVVLDDERGRDVQQDPALGWIIFDPSGVPEALVHLSHQNVTQMVDAIDAYRNRPTGYKELLVARALGRALAHELGHFLMASKNHSPSGLMKGRRLADELFSPMRTGFQLNDAERRLALHGLALIAAQPHTPTEEPVEQHHDATPIT
jgi:hypothetical protein